MDTVGVLALDIGGILRPDDATKCYLISTAGVGRTREMTLFREMAEDQYPSFFFFFFFVFLWLVHFRVPVGPFF